MMTPPSSPFCVARSAHRQLPRIPASIDLLADPQWLLDGYSRTGNLGSASDEDFRLIISAVLAVDRRVWDATGGFDEDFVGYGGEDWDFGWRAWLSGADFAYQPDAVAWHDGPDASSRTSDPTVKNTESLRLAQTIALPSVRGTGLVLDQPEIVVRYVGPTAGNAADAAVVACVAGLLSGSDAAVWFPGCGGQPASPTSRTATPAARSTDTARGRPRPCSRPRALSGVDRAAGAPVRPTASLLPPRGVGHSRDAARSTDQVAAQE